MTNTILEKIHSYPIKGFPVVEHAETSLRLADGIPGDRQYAITRGTIKNADWMPAGTYYQNSRVDGLLNYKLSQDKKGVLEIESPSGSRITIDPKRRSTLDEANSELSDFLKELGVAADGPAPRITERSGPGNWDYPDTPVSLINANSIREMGKALGAELDPIRFRCNLLLEGLPAWEEFSFAGKRIKIGDAELEVMRPILRCPAPGVNPATGDRDIQFASRMPEHFGHAYCGVYAVTAHEGKINCGDKVEIIGNCDMSLETASKEAEDIRRWPRSVDITSCQIGEETTRLSLAANGKWPLPDANPGQRLRILMGADCFTSEYIAATSPGHYHLEIGKSQTSDPATEKLRTQYKSGDQLVICGPFGKA